jgi:UDP-glucose:glycoprotein glucosyltransferase
MRNSEYLLNRDADSTEQPELFDFDHVYSRANITAPVAIFYGAVGTKCFKELHVQLAEASKQVT